MPNVCKRIFSLLLVVALALVCSTTAFAAEPTVQNATTVVATETVDILPTAVDHIVGIHVGSSSTSTTSSKFTIAGGSAKMTADISVGAPCNFYIRLTDSRGNSLGITSFNITHSGGFTIDLLPATLSSRSYGYQFFFDRSGVSYQLYVKATN